MVLEMSVRYIALLTRAAQEIHLAKLSRSAVPRGVGETRAWAAAGVGELYRRSRSLADGVALAMASRGYTGEVRLLAPAKWRGGDTLALGVAVLVGTALLLSDGVGP
jgi:cobalt/nickel transport system permease protein